MKNIVFILFLCVFSKGFCQKGINIQVLNLPEKVKPGGHITLFFDVKDISPNQGITKATLELPKDWQIILSKQIGNSPDNIKFIYTVASTPTSHSGSYNLTFRLNSNDGAEIRKKINIEVTTIRKVEIVYLSSPEYVREGDSLHLDYLIQNFGNNQEKIQLQTSRGTIQTKNDSLIIEPHKSLQVRISQKVPKSESNYWLMSNDLFVSLKDSANPIANFNSVPVYSNQNKKSDPYLRFPIEMGVWYSRFNTSNQVSSSFQYDVRGRGFLDFDKKHHLDFTIHGPNQINLPAIGSYDQYSLNYSFKNKTTITLGDYSLAFNNLMEFGRYGRGIHFEQKFARTGFNTFYLKPRFYPNQKDTYGASFFYKPKENLRFSVDFLSKNVKFNNQWFDATFVGLSIYYRTNALFINTELSGGYGNRKADLGIFNRLYYRYKKIQFTSDFIYAGKNFYGFYHNSWQSVNSINYYLVKKVSLGLQSNFTRVNPSFDTFVLTTSPYYSNNNLSLNYDINPQNRLILSYNIEEKEDRQEIKQFYYHEKYGRLSHYINSETFQLWFESRYGLAQNLLAKVDEISATKSIRASIQPQAKIIQWFWLGTLFEYQRNAKFSTNNQQADYFYYGGTSRITFNQIFNASFSYRNNYSPDELIQKRSFLDLTAELNLKQHKLSFVGGRIFIPNYNQNSDNTLYFMLKYTYRLNTPIAKNKKLGSIKGSILGANDIKKSGILVSLGDKKFLTDVNGNFYFNDLVPDKYHVTLDKSTVNTGTITTVKTPIEVEVVAKSVNDISIPLVVSGGVSGKVIFQTNDENVANINQQKTIIIAKLFNEEESFLTRVNEKGEFSFKEMKPGQWQIKVSLLGNQERFVVENSLQTITIESKKQQEVLFTVQAKERKIYFSDKNFQLSSKK